MQSICLPFLDDYNLVDIFELDPIHLYAKVQQLTIELQNLKIFKQILKGEEKNGLPIKNTD